LNKKTLLIQSGSYSTSLAQSWANDNEGRVTSAVYPAAGLNQDGTNARAQAYSYGYDVMGRLSTMQSTVSPNPPTNVVTGTTYGPAGELLTISFSGRPNETRTYNSLLQLTGLNESTFSYQAGLNNGRIQSETNTTTGEQVTYAYDALNRLISAVTTDNPNVTQWGQQFVYDGFGNLREKDLIKGSAPTLSVLVDAATNRLPLYQYDANGNQLTTNTQTLTYNYENRLSQATTASNAWTKYSYDPDGRRSYSKDLVNTTITERLYIYGLGSELMATYILKTSGSSVYTVLESHRGYFGSRLTEQGTNNSGAYAVTAVTPNRLGGVGKNYPYGENGSTGAIFATYTRDSGGLDYALLRDYYSTTARFLTPDPYRAATGSGDPADPQSWNRYAYTRNNPVNRIDPKGLYDCDPAEPLCQPPCSPSFLPVPGGGCGPDLDPDFEPPPPPARRTFTITCTITLEYRGVNAPLFRGYNHAYIFVTKTIQWSDGEVQDSADLVEGLPERRKPFNWGNLKSNVFYNFNTSGDARDPDDHPFDPRNQSKAGNSHLKPLSGGLDVCNKAADIENSASKFPTYRYDPTNGRLTWGKGRNSNWYAQKLLSDNGIDLGTPPGTPGWR
jgi:RHS repeat-associated protein